MFDFTNMTENDTLTPEQIVNDLPVWELTNTDEDTFFWTSRKFEKRFAHEKARVGSRFVDGNNGDSFRVIAANPQRKRMIVTNLTQGNEALVIWD